MRKSSKLIKRRGNRLHNDGGDSLTGGIPKCCVFVCVGMHGCLLPSQSQWSSSGLKSAVKFIVI
jgi:hypothetical protein